MGAWLSKSTFNKCINLCGLWEFLLLQLKNSCTASQFDAYISYNSYLCNSSSQKCLTIIADETLVIVEHDKQTTS